MEKVTNFEGTWCEATEENYLILLLNNDIHTRYLRGANVGYYAINITHESRISIFSEWFNSKDAMLKQFNCRQIELINGEFYYSDSIQDISEDEQCQFTKYGFEKPELECEILKEDEYFLYGVIDKVGGQWFPTSWTKHDGKCIQNPEGLDYDLKPIKQEQTLNEILQDIQDKNLSVHVGELLIKTQFNID